MQHVSSRRNNATNCNCRIAAGSASTLVSTYQPSTALLSNIMAQIITSALRSRMTICHQAHPPFILSSKNSNAGPVEKQLHHQQLVHMFVVANVNKVPLFTYLGVAARSSTEQVQARKVLDQWMPRAPYAHASSPLLRR